MLILLVTYTYITYNKYTNAYKFLYTDIISTFKCSLRVIEFKMFYVGEFFRAFTPTCSASLTVSGNMMFLLSGKVTVMAAATKDAAPNKIMVTYSPKYTVWKKNWKVRSHTIHQTDKSQRKIIWELSWTETWYSVLYTMGHYSYQIQSAFLKQIRLIVF